MNFLNIIQAFICLYLFQNSKRISAQEQEYRNSDLDNEKCDSIICASIVSKCLLTQDCKCANIHSNKTCALNCSQCLDYLYQDCCLCFDLCEKPKEPEGEIQQRSNVGHIKDPQPDFFALLTESPDPLERWKTISFSLILPFEESATNDREIESEQPESELEMKCTVAYMAQCISLSKCQRSCASMGSTTYRWFHDGCCQCVGQYCNEFGLAQSNCTACPLIFEQSDSTSISFDKEDL